MPVPPAPPQAPGQPPVGSSPATSPVPNKGLEAAGMAKLGLVVRQLEQLVPLLGVGTEAGQAVVKALTNLSKHVQPGAVSPGAEQSGLQLYDVYMPELAYTSCSVQHYDFTRTVENGIGVLIADVWLLQIRISNSGENDTQQPSGADSVNTGSVQPQPVTPVQSSQLDSVT